jgi:hypothetical protein
MIEMPEVGSFEVAIKRAITGRLSSPVIIRPLPSKNWEYLKSYLLSHRR